MYLYFGHQPAPVYSLSGGKRQSFTKNAERVKRLRVVTDESNVLVKRSAFSDLHRAGLNEAADLTREGAQVPHHPPLLEGLMELLNPLRGLQFLLFRGESKAAPLRPSHIVRARP